MSYNGQSPDVGAYEFMLGDFEPDGDVDFRDFAMLASAWQKGVGELGYNPRCDISNPANDFIDILDIDAFAANWLAGTQ